MQRQQRPKGFKRKVASRVAAALILTGLGGKIAHQEVQWRKTEKELARLEEQRKISDVEHARKMKEIEENSKKEWKEWEAKQKKDQQIKKQVLPKKRIPTTLPERNYFERFQSMDYATAVSFFRKNKIVMRQQYTAYLSQMSPAQRIARAQRNKQRYAPVVEKYARLNGVDPLIAKKLIQKESSWDPIAVSSTGAFGLCQVNSYIYASKFFPSYHHNPFRTEETIRASMSYLGVLTRKYSGDQQKILTAYALGEPMVDKAIKSRVNWSKAPKIASSTYYTEVISQKI